MGGYKGNKMKILARHKNLVGCTITESIASDETRRFTATIRGFQNWLIHEGKEFDIQKIIKRVRAIRQLIDHGVDKIFYVEVKIDSKKH